MKARALSEVWASPDNTRLAPKQVSVRLPVHVLARVYALEKLYPKRTRTEIISDLLTSALEEMERGLPRYKGEVVDGHPDYGDLYEVLGPFTKYRLLANEFYEEIEKELGSEEVAPLFDGIGVPATADYFERKP